MKRTDTLRRRLAWLLLGLFVAFIGVGPLHRHADTARAVPACEQCLHHDFHQAHFSAGSTPDTPCVLCQLSGAACLLPPEGPAVSAALTPQGADAAPAALLPQGVAVHLLPRAPPSVLPA